MTTQKMSNDVGESVNDYDPCLDPTTKFDEISFLPFLLGCNFPLFFLF